MDICGVTQWVLSRLKGSIYPVYTGYIPKPILISDFQFSLLACCFAPKTTELKQSHLFLKLWACHHAWQQQKPAVLPPPRGAKQLQPQQEQPGAGPLLRSAWMSINGYMDVTPKTAAMTLFSTTLAGVRSSTKILISASRIAVR